MRKHNIRHIIFSILATVYVTPAEIPISEENLKALCNNPYGCTMFMLEKILVYMDIQQSDLSWNIISLRYFNPIGANKSCIILYKSDERNRKYIIDKL